MTQSPTASSSKDPTGLLARWYTYQSERFPLLQHGMLVLAFSSCAVLYSSQLRGLDHLPPLASFITAFFTCLLFFLQLRIADEFKDFEEDSKYRPYRPVPRGLVTLRQLGILFVLTAILQLALALWLEPRLTLLLIITWAYLAGMSKEFFAGHWLRARPILYMTSHMVIMPLIDLYATGCEWVPSGQSAPSGLSFFLAASYFNGLVIEIGRKIRAPADEETGVQTYSVQWGRARAVAVWLAVMATTAFLAGMAGFKAGVPWLIALYAILVALAAFTGLWFLKNPNPKAGKKIELASGLWTLALYLALGLIPLFLK
jgi:4-hydroxybenzoate polyprenyltransferase